MISSYYHWIDLIWIPICYYTVHERHRWLGFGFVVASVILIHLITETMIELGYKHGIMGIIQTHVHIRGLVISSFFYAIYVAFAHFSKNTEKSIFLAASLSIFFMIFLFASFAMLL